MAHLEKIHNTKKPGKLRFDNRFEEKDADKRRFARKQPKGVEP
jgi:hypothetical protein